MNYLLSHIKLQFSKIYFRKEPCFLLAFFYAAQLKIIPKKFTCPASRIYVKVTTPRKRLTKTRLQKSRLMPVNFKEKPTFTIGVSWFIRPCRKRLRILTGAVLVRREACHPESWKLSSRSILMMKLSYCPKTMLGKKL